MLISGCSVCVCLPSPHSVENISTVTATDKELMILGKGDSDLGKKKKAREGISLVSVEKMP